MWVNRSEFLKALDSVKPGLGRKGDTGKSFHFSNGWVFACNGEIAISAPLPNGLDIQGAVPAKELSTMLAKIEAEQIGIAAEPERIRITVDTMKVRIKCSKSSLPTEVMQKPAADAWINLSDDFREKLKLCLLSIGKNPNDPVLQCVHCHGNIIEACDNMRMTRCITVSSLPEGIKFLIPDQLASALIKHDLISFGTNGDWLYFRSSDDTLISCHIFKEDFPDLSGLLSLQYNPAFRFPADFKDILNIAGIAAPEDPLRRPFIGVHIEGGVLTVRAKKEKHESEQSRIIHCKETLQFQVNPKFLLKIIAKGFDKPSISERHDNDNVRFLRFDGDNFTHIVGVTSGATEPKPQLGDASIHPGKVQSARSPIATATEMYFAGTLGFEFNYPRLMDEIENRLVSFPYMTPSLNKQYFVDHKFKKIIIDSGAFSVWNKGETIDFNKYLQYCMDNIKNATYVVNLDIIPGQPGDKNLRLMQSEVECSASEGYENYKKMIQAGIPKEKVIHVFHQGESWKWLEHMADEMTYIGLSPGNDRSREEKIDWLMDCMKYVTDCDGRPIIKFHGFAVTSLKAVRLFPWASIDSSTWGIAAGLGRIMIPRRKGDGWWDFSSDTPLIYNCSQVQDNLEHVDHQPGSVQDLISDYFQSLDLAKGESTYRVVKKTKGKRAKDKKKMAETVGRRAGWSQVGLDFEETFGKSSIELAPDEEWEETIIEPGVINSVDLRQYLNVRYLNEFLKTLPEDRRFVKPTNRVDIRGFLERRSGKGVKEVLNLRENKARTGATPTASLSSAPSTAKKEKGKRLTSIYPDGHPKK
ncbi:MAG: hypothetical protein ABSF90_15155 [Syntrophobacteraceae bacterium]|jgi:hypothetical protein